MLSSPELPHSFRPPTCGETLRTIALGEHTVSYVLRRARRRSIGLSIDHRGLRVGAPSGASLHDVEASILQHREWIRSKLDEWQARPHPEPLRIVDGVQIPLLGSPITVSPGHRRQALRLEPANARTRTHPVSALTRRSTAAARESVARAGQHAVRRAPGPLRARLGVALPRLSLSSARTRWGSCSLRSGIRLNWRLIHFPLPVIDYVAVHELAHLREMNHSARFWSIVAQVYPDYPNARKALQLGATHCPHW
jgi:predicted metal-dependent hydrolase